MARPLRIEYPGAYYHVTPRSNERKAIFRDNQDREKFLELLSCAIKEFHLRLHCYVLMSNHDQLSGTEGCGSEARCGIERGGKLFWYQGRGDSEERAEIYRGTVRGEFFAPPLLSHELTGDRREGSAALQLGGECDTSGAGPTDCVSGKIVESVGREI